MSHSTSILLFNGIFPENYRVLKVDSSSNFALLSEVLSEVISKDLSFGLIPFFLYATVGTTSSAAVDPLLKLAKISKDRSALIQSLSTNPNEELQQLQERMADHQRYRTTGRAYMLSGLSSHSMQRATALGNSTDSANPVGAYQTQSMVDMVRRSQMLGPPSPRSPAGTQGR
uniref:VWA-Hint protein Vwaint domain-containing protein n=1 Tax=Ananas comosus var. bracteatus TaxID=296719 RepID=A0A6V7P1E6_ANACO|nr:unnamed protein product [Ananas comosus var. bracteatus]